MTEETRARRRRWVRPTAAVLTVVCCLFGAHRIGRAGLLRLGGNAAFLSAMLAMPEGAAGYREERTAALPVSTPDASSAPPTETPSEADMESRQESTPPETAASSQPGEPIGRVKTVTLSTSAANVEGEGVHVNNQTKAHGLDVAAVLAAPLAVSVTADGSPQVLIVHTHTTEAYAARDDGYYDEQDVRSTDPARGVCRVGEELAEQLRAAGIGTLHDVTLHDYPSYSGSYNAAAATIRQYLQDYPSLQVVIDVHRDSISQGDGVRLKPTATVDGRAAAQCMILSGCQEGSVTDFDDWQRNLTLTLRLQREIESRWPTLARPLLFTARRYNMHLTHGSFLVEVGSEANTLEEAAYTGRLIGQALADVLLDRAGN